MRDLTASVTRNQNTKSAHSISRAMCDQAAARQRIRHLFSFCITITNSWPPSVWPTCKIACLAGTIPILMKRMNRLSLLSRKMNDQGPTSMELAASPVLVRSMKGTASVVLKARDAGLSRPPSKKTRTFYTSAAGELADSHNVFGHAPVLSRLKTRV